MNASTPTTPPRSDVIQVFMDTEHIKAKAAPVLVSIALVESKRHFYGERPPGSFRSARANQFVRTEVLPQLDRCPGIQGSDVVIARGLVDWLNALATERVEVHYDFSVDYLLLERLVDLADLQVSPALVPVHVSYLLEDDSGIAAAERSWAATAASMGLHRHHALADALALQARFEAVHHSSQGGAS